MEVIMKKYSGIIFDLDGTLLDTAADLGHSANLVLEEFGQPLHSMEDYRRFVGNGLVNLMRQCFPAGTPDEEFPAIMESMYRQYDLHYMDETAPYPGIVSLLSQLQNAGFCMCVNSNKKESYTKSLVSKCFPGINFTDVLGENDRFPRKPDPSAALYLASQMNLSPEAVIYIGDSGIDIDTAHNAGMDCAGCLWGFRGETELKAHEADYIVSCAEDILKILNVGI